MALLVYKIVDSILALACLQRERLDIPDVNKKMTSFGGQTSWAKMMSAGGQANSAGMPPHQISK
jgi:hypothetical protein